MTRFVWAAWGLLVVVLDLPLLGWDVLPDVVGYSWIVIGLAGAAEVHEAFVRARAAAAAGIPVAVVSGTPLFNDLYGVEWGAAFAGILVFVTVCTSWPPGFATVLPRATATSGSTRAAIRIAAPAAGVVQLVGLVAISTALAPLYFLGLLGLVVVGIVTVVLVHRVNRAGWLGTTGEADTTPVARELDRPTRGEPSAQVGDALVEQVALRDLGAPTRCDRPAGRLPPPTPPCRSGRQRSWEAE